MPDRKKIDDPKRFYRACNPARTLDYSDPEDQRYYIDFTEVRSGNMIRELMRTITFSDDPTCQLFSGHIGCGKSTELLRLKAELEADGYHVVYFVSSEDLDMGDVDITDILFVITRKISDSLATEGISELPPGVHHPPHPDFRQRRQCAGQSLRGSAQGALHGPDTASGRPSIWQRAATAQGDGSGTGVP